MRALSNAWHSGGGTVLGIAPSAAAAAVLGDQINVATDTMAKLVWSLNNDPNNLPDWARAVDQKTLLIVDEAGMADTLSLDTVVTFALARGAKVRLIGDDQQLAAIGAGGVLRDIEATHGALRLNELMRFTTPGEGAASLALRDGDHEALGFYLDRAGSTSATKPPWLKRSSSPGDLTATRVVNQSCSPPPATWSRS